MPYLAYLCLLLLEMITLGVPLVVQSFKKTQSQKTYYLRSLALQVRWTGFPTTNMPCKHVDSWIVFLSPYRPQLCFVTLLCKRIRLCRSSTLQQKYLSVLGECLSKPPPILCVNQKQKHLLKDVIIGISVRACDSDFPLSIAYTILGVSSRAKEECDNNRSSYGHSPTGMPVH